MASDAFHPSPIPKLHTPKLFVFNIPQRVHLNDIQRVFQNFPHTRFNVVPNKGSLEYCKGAEQTQGLWATSIEFDCVRDAERALATRHSRPVPPLNPPYILNLTPSSEGFPLSTLFSGRPRLVKGLPVAFTDAHLYDLLQPFGAIAVARKTKSRFGLVQFWTEEEAAQVEAIFSPKSTEADRWQIALIPYDPCRLYCWDADPEIDAIALDGIFREFGVLSSSRIYHTRDGNYGSVTFLFPEQALAAVCAMDGTRFGSRVRNVEFHEITGTYGHRKAQALAPQSFRGANGPPHTARVRKNERPQNSPGINADASHLREDSTEESNLLIERLNERNVFIASEAARHKRDMRRLIARYTKAVELLQERIDEREKFSKSEASHHAKVVQCMIEENRTLLDECKDWKRRFAIAESRLKARERETDQPMWEAKQKRERREQQHKEQKQKREVDSVAAAGWRQEREEAKKRTELEGERQERDPAGRVRKSHWACATAREEARCMRRDQRWKGRRWTAELASERFEVLMDEFEKLNFSEDQPLTSAAVPWPVLAYPFVSGPNGEKRMEAEITSANVEAFFRALRKLHRNESEYNKIVEKAYRLFHPDQWKSRGIVITVMDNAPRELLETKGKVVIRALAPLWRKSKGFNG